MLYHRAIANKNWSSKNLISNEDIKTDEFLKLKNWLENNFREVVIYTVLPIVKVT